MYNQNGSGNVAREFHVNLITVSLLERDVNWLLWSVCQYKFIESTKVWKCVKSCMPPVGDGTMTGAMDCMYSICAVQGRIIKL